HSAHTYYGAFFFFFSSRRRHTRSKRDWSSDVCSSDLQQHNASYQHGAGSKRAQAAHQVGALELTAGILGTGVQCNRAINVAEQCSEQYNANDPQQSSMWQEWLADATQEFSVNIKCFFTAMRWRVKLQVTGHVADDEQSKNKAGYSHGELQRPRRN